MRKVAMMVILLSLFASFAEAHTWEQRRDDLAGELARHFDPVWIRDVFNHQNLCEGREVPIERLEGGWTELEAQTMSEPSLLRGELVFRANETVFRGAAERFDFSGGSLEPYVLAAILRIESDFGDHLIGTPVVRTLFDKYRRIVDGPQGNQSRAEMLRKEILPFLKAAAENTWDVCGVLGSRAAAFGYTQFIPGSLYLAVDGDDDGKVDIQRNLADAVHSAAHHLQKRGGSQSLTRALWRYNNDYRYGKIVQRYAQELRRRIESHAASPTPVAD
jgi:membrane-bound lytic murein transglycosylase B